MFENIAYAKLNLEYNQRLFELEYDKLIAPHGVPISNGIGSWNGTRKLNQTWGMVDPALYDQCSIETEFNSLDARQMPQWNMVQLLELQTTDDDHLLIKQAAKTGGTFVRNLTLDRTWTIKPEFSKLKIVEFINTLPFSKISSIHCVHLEPGRFASIHRDSRWSKEITNTSPAANNGVYKKGFVVLTLNISDGGVPLFWALDGKDAQNPLTANDPAYIISDYFLHGVPVCTSRRRQVRITGVPTKELADLIDSSTKVLIPPDYEFDTADKFYPG